MLLIQKLMNVRRLSKPTIDYKTQFKYLKLKHSFIAEKTVKFSW